MTGRQKSIANPGQAFALGASWGTPSVDNQMTTELCDLINGTGQALFTGDIVALDPTGTQAVLATTATLNCAIGTVGSALEASSYPAVESIAGANVTNTFPVIVGSTGGVGISTLTADGNVQPFQDYPWITANMGFTNGSATVTYAGASASDVGKYILTPYNSTTNANPQVFQVLSVTPGTSYTVGVVSGAGTTFSGTTGTFLVSMGRDTTTKGPGWSVPLGWTNTSAFPPGVVVPVVVSGFGRVNINGLTTGVAGSFALATNASVVATLVLTGALTAAQTGLTIATWLEPYAQRDTTVGTVLGITGHDSVRAIIGKM